MAITGSYVPLSARWWKSEHEQLWTVLQSVTHRLRERNKPRRDQYQIMAELYGGVELSGLGLTAYDPAAQIFHPSTLPFNIMRNGIDTVVAKVGKNRPRPLFLTDHGDEQERKKAENLQRFIDGMFYQLQLYDKTIPCLRDACLFGTGILSVYRREDVVYIERIFPFEIIVDIADARYGSPQNIYLSRWIDKDVLAEMFPDHEEAIHSANITTDDIDHVQDYEATADKILVHEAWHLPSGPKAKDGRHACIIEGITLVDEPYNKHYFPFAFMRYKEPVAGFWGESLGSELMGFQTEINDVSERVQQAHYLVGGGIWLVADGADIVDTELTNGIGIIVHHKPGMKPEYINPEPVHPETYNYLKDLPQLALQFSGISQMSAQSMRPNGITAAKALQTLDDVETERFNLIGRWWENFHLDITRQVIDLCKEISDEYPDFAVRAPMRRASINLNWKDVDLDKDAYVMQVFPTAFLAKTPAARLQQVQDLFQAGIIDRAMFLRLLDAPDINAEEDLEGAAREVADEQISYMLDSEDPDEPGVYQSPEPFQDLVYAMHRAQANYNLGKIRGVDARKLSLLQQYMGDCFRLLQMQNPPAPPPAVGGMPGGNPAGDVAGPAPMVGMPTAVPSIPGQGNGGNTPPQAPPAPPPPV